MTHQRALPEETKAKQDHAVWLDDVRRWRAEHHQALVDLTKVLTAILEHEEELVSYASQIQSHEEYLQEYESAQCESGFHDFEELEARRLQFGAKHNLRRQKHDQTRARHVNVWAEIEKLVQGVT